MGAALLSTPDILLNILRALLESISLPISCKIRLLPTQPSTQLLVSRILRTGIRNLTVHCRTRNMRPGEPAIWERLGDLVELGKRRGIPVICNGDGDGWANWEHIRSTTGMLNTLVSVLTPGADSVMLARAAEKNPSIFLPTGPVCNVSQVIPRLLSVAKYVDNPWGNTRFLLTQFKPSAPPISNLNKVQRRDIHDNIMKSKTFAEVVEKLGIKLLPGMDVMDQIQAKIDARVHPDVFVQRKEAEEAGNVLDEPVLDEPVEISEPVSEVCLDGSQVGGGQATP